MMAAPKLVTAEELLWMPETTGPLELVRGQVIKSSWFNVLHGLTTAQFSSTLDRWSEDTALGVVGVRAGFILARNPDTVRAPDVWFVRRDRLPATGIPDGYLEAAPDLAVEVVSFADTAQSLREKIDDDLASGTPLVWVVYPTTRTVIAHTPDGLARNFLESDTITAPDVLPGFSCPVADLFD